MKVVAIIQARMNSSRLPNKVLMLLAGKPVLEHVVDRIDYCEEIDKVVVATSVNIEDNAIHRWAKERNVFCYRGSLTDVLDRYYQAALQHEADVVVRITADCPAIDPNTVDEVIRGFITGDYDAYSLGGEFPDGLDCQVFSFSALEKAWSEATLPSEREHVGPYIEKTHPELFKIGSLEKFHGLSHHRWTLDEPCDYQFLQAVFEHLYDPEQSFSVEDFLSLLAREPELAEINSGIQRNEGYLKSVLAEKEL